MRYFICVRSTNNHVCRFSLTSRARAYFDSRKASATQASTSSHLQSNHGNDLELSSSSASNSRKGSAVATVSHINNYPSTSATNQNHNHQQGFAVLAGNACTNCKGTGVDDAVLALPTATAKHHLHPHPSTLLPDFGRASAGGLETSVGVGTPRRGLSRDGQEGVRVERQVEVRDEYRNDFGNV